MCGRFGVVPLHTAHDGKVDLLPSYTLHGSGLVLEGAPEAPVWCQLVGADGEVILMHRCHFRNAHHDPDAATFDVHEAVPWDPATRSIEFLRGGKVIDRIEVEADTPKLTVKPPRRAEREPELMRVEWEAQHSKKLQIPPDLVVKRQAVDIAEIISLLI